MAMKRLAMLGALLSIANPSYAFDDNFGSAGRAQTVMFYYAVPFGTQSRKERTPWMGMLIQGRQDFRGSSVGDFGIDTRLFTLAEQSGAAEASLLLIGAAVLGGAAVVTHKSKSSQQQVQSQPQTPAPASQVPCTTGCPAH